MKLLLAISAILCVGYTLHLEEDSPMVSTNIGVIRGRTMGFSSRFLSQRGEVDVYQGIPFAKPPVDELRFRPAEEVDPWDNVYDAVDIPPSCQQIFRPFYQLYTTLDFSEDCLYLNVFVPRRLPPNAPVMVYIHGGSFTLGSGSDLPHMSLPLATLGEVILVTVNYRLNVFGFFSTGDDAIPANLGLTDQRLALKWVYENIQAFGGDPRKVTIFGQSAGAASVGWHILSNGSRQYFQRAILQSGTPTAIWAPVHTLEESRYLASLVAEIAGCSSTGDTNAIADCLRAKTAEELLALHNSIDETFQGQPFWGAINDGVFFTDNVTTLITEGSYRDVDIMIGTTRDEGTFCTYFVTGLPKVRPFVTKEFLLLLTSLSNNSLVGDLIEAIYSSGVGTDGNYVGALEYALGDLSYKCKASSFARSAANAGSTVYMYEMAQEPVRSVWNVSWLRASHSEDLQFVFGLPFFNHAFYTPVFEELKVSFYVMRMWTNFAKSGNPNLPDPLPNSIPEWPQFVPGVEEYKELDIMFANNRMLRQHQCNFWFTLLPQIQYLQDAVAANDENWRGR